MRPPLPCSLDGPDRPCVLWERSCRVHAPFFRYEFLALIYEWEDRSSLEVADAFLRASWLARARENREKERLYQREAVRRYEEALEVGECRDQEQRATVASLLFDSMRRSLCLETRYLDPVEQDKAKATAHQYLNERWAFAADENLETAKYLILTKRPEYRGKPRTDLIPGGSRSRLLKDIKTAEGFTIVTATQTSPSMRTRT